MHDRGSTVCFVLVIIGMQSSPSLKQCVHSLPDHILQPEKCESATNASLDVSNHFLGSTRDESGGFFLLVQISM